MKEIEELLRQTMGLHAPTIGTALVERAVRARMGALAIENPNDYARLVKQSTAEWNALVESVVVTETWFFRDREPFRALTEVVNRDWLPANPHASLKILSIPCSTGEEPYSIAMSLLDAGIPEMRFQIDAFDIRPEAIAQAQQAVYGKNSFRGKDLGFRARHFQPVEKCWLLNPRVRQRVRFQTGNILDGQCLAQPGAYDFIFCRNLLIYFDQPTQQRVVCKLHTLLKPTGVLFVGSAEVPITARNGFVSSKIPLSFSCHKADAKIHLPQTPLPESNFETEVISRASELKPAHAAVSSADLQKARRLADQGRLSEAEQICEQYLREGGVSAEAYYLLGLMREAIGAESQAGEFYRKALYLEPNHYETLLQWASLSERNGDNAHTRILKERVKRIKDHA